ncbi:MAG: hypothetical protein JWR37_228 [Mycobacterium sp.]|nr:hypothetical protein [Mycobacterium sp.]
MATRLSKEDRIQRLVDKTRKRVHDKPEAKRSLQHSPDSMLGVMVREAGYERISAKLLEELDGRLRAAGLGTYPELTDPSNSRKTRIHFFDLKNPVPGFQHPRQLFAEEKELSRFLWLNRAALPYAKKTGLRIRGQQVRIADNCIIDLLAEDKKTRELVGFELKATQGDDRLVGQAAKYMRSLARQAAQEDRPGARLLIVTGQPDEDLAERVQTHAKEHGVETEWLLYHVSIDLSEVK